MFLCGWTVGIFGELSESLTFMKIKPFFRLCLGENDFGHSFELAFETIYVCFFGFNHFNWFDTEVKRIEKTMDHITSVELSVQLKLLLNLYHRQPTAT